MFSLTENEQVKLKQHIENWNALILEKQKNEMSTEEFNCKTCNGAYPYLGAIGGNYKYSFTPTSIGMFVEVTNIYLNETVNLTDYESW